MPTTHRAQSPPQRAYPTLPYRECAAQEMVAVERVLEYARLPPQADTLPPAPAAPEAGAGAGQGGPAAAGVPAARARPPQQAEPLWALAERPPSFSFGGVGVGAGGRSAGGAGGGAPGGALPPGWPGAGAVRFEGVRLRYEARCGPGATGGVPAACDVPWALAGLDLELRPGERMGLVGRTGAGKSSVVAALLRLVEIQARAPPPPQRGARRAWEVVMRARVPARRRRPRRRRPAAQAGRITIDGVDVRRVPLAALRAALGVVPQAPFLFEGSIRANLDPAGAFSDTTFIALCRSMRLWDILAGLSLSRTKRRGAAAAPRAVPQPPGSPAYGACPGSAWRTSALFAQLCKFLPASMRAAASSDLKHSFFASNLLLTRAVLGFPAVKCCARGFMAAGQSQRQCALRPAHAR